ncbi:MAG TPA: hypothetical protein EYN96_06830, partial [Candidatus Hydrogenedentes bacterium]|nr:hypothetical protein [Candidatus Hydrogenedentota bacterium]
MTRFRGNRVLADVSVLAFCAILIYFEQIFSGTRLGYSRGILNDLFLITWPTLEYTAQRLLDGELPLWNPYWFGGMPNLAVPSSMALYPTTVLFGILPFHEAYKVVGIFHSFLGAVFCYMLGRHISQYRSVAIICGFQFFILHIVHAVVGVTGVLLLGHIWTTQTAAWAPLGFLALLHLLDRWSHGWGIIFVGALVMSLLAGDPQTFSYILLWYGGYTTVFLVYDLVFGDGDLRRTLVRGTSIVGCLLLMILMCSVIVLPMGEFLNESIRKNGFTYQEVTGPFSGENFRFYLNILTTHRPLMFVTGKVVLALAFTAIVSRKRKMTVALMVTGTACAIYSLMPRWLFEGVVQHLPMYGNQSVPLRAAMSVGFIFIVITGLGVHTLIDRNRTSDGGSTHWIGFACILTVLSICPFFFESEIAPLNLAASIVCVLGAVVFWRIPRIAFMAAPMLITLVVIPGIFVARDIAQIGHVTRNESPEEFATFVDSDPDLVRTAIFMNRSSLNLRKDPAKVQGLALRHRSRSIGGHHSLVSHRYARFLSEISGFEFVRYDGDGRLDLDRSLYIGGDWLTVSSAKVLDLLNVKYLVTFAPPLSALESNPRFRRFEQG